MVQERITISQSYALSWRVIAHQMSVKVERRKSLQMLPDSGEQKYSSFNPYCISDRGGEEWEKQDGLAHNSQPWNEM